MSSALAESLVNVAKPHSSGGYVDKKSGRTLFTRELQDVLEPFIAARLIDHPDAPSSCSSFFLHKGVLKKFHFLLTVYFETFKVVPKLDTQPIKYDRIVRRDMI